MFLRKKANKSGSTSFQIISKSSGRYKVVKTIGCAHTEQEATKLARKIHQRGSKNGFKVLYLR